MQTGNLGGDRRSFIKKMAIGSGVLAGIFSSRQNAQAEEEIQAASAAGEVLYRETEDFKKYYEALRS